jgi:L-ribulokinase
VAKWATGDKTDFIPAAFRLLGGIRMSYAIGVDYGTLSGRVLLLDLRTGAECAVHAVPYRHGVIDEKLPGTDELLPPDWALQHPDDYIDVLETGIPEVIKTSGIDAGEIIGIGIDFTSCTVLPVTKEGLPLSKVDAWAKKPHAWPKLWKHHAAQRYADKINEVAAARNEDFLSRYGGRISSEWYFPKLLEIFAEDRAVYDACAAFVEATDWIVWYLTGREYRNSCTAGYKAMWSEKTGIPSQDFFAAVHPEFTNPAAKLGTRFYPLGSRAGYVRPDIAAKLGLSNQVAVAAGNVDAHVSVPGAGVSGPGALVMVMGTSICHLVMTDEEVRLPGITGVVQDGVLPGFYGYEAGQAAVGDMFGWFVKRMVPESYMNMASQAGMSIYEYMESLAERILPGETGLVALDWWNGNRSILGDADLTGLVFGLTLATKPEEIYRALLEATAYGTRRIVDSFQEYGVALRELVACGGIAKKSPLLMQMYADICGLPVTVRSSTEIPARGSALFGSVAAGSGAGGFDTIQEASEKLPSAIFSRYIPDLERHKRFDEVYQVYRELYDYFGVTHVDLTHKLKNIRLETVRQHQTA